MEAYINSALVSTRHLQAGAGGEEGSGFTGAVVIATAAGTVVVAAETHH